jgi:hypothetical protein
MSEESAMFRIVKCSDNEEYEVHGIENKGRYYIANVQDNNGQVVKKIIVDKLNGKVKFIR